jgi:hypothetical protein
MDQSVVQKVDDAMVVRMRMTGGQGVRSSYETEYEVVPLDADRCRVQVRCTATPTTEPSRVEGMLRSLFVLSLSTLKSNFVSRG